ncbi:MAG: adenine phosphoribosyltransferase [Dehalococcoidia bacterium]
MAIDYASLIRNIPDFPEPGIIFRDITPLLGNAEAYRGVIQDLTAPFRDQQIDQVIAIEARGYLLGAPMALELNAGFVPVRKIGKLPFHTYRAEYALEYGQAVIEMHQDGLLKGQRVLVVDDVLATGGTVNAAMDLVRQSGAIVAGVSILIELAALQGRDRLHGYPLHTLITF